MAGSAIQVITYNIETCQIIIHVLLDNDGINEVKQSSSGDEGVLSAGDTYLLDEQGNDKIR